MRHLLLTLYMTLIAASSADAASSTGAVSSAGAVTPMALPAGVTPQYNLTYATRGTHALTLDFYRPASDVPVPVVIWIHGGGWTGGTRAIKSPVRLLPHGYAVAAISYRFAPKPPATGAIFPAQIEDCRSAVRWLRANAQQLGIDPKRIGAWGLSAGGHLAALLGTSAARKEWDVGEHLDQSSAVQAVCDWFGVTQFLPPDGQDVSAERSRGDLINLLGAQPSAVPALANAASPLTHITAECPPFLIMHGDKDNVVLPYHSKNFHDALTAVGVKSTYILVPGNQHGMKDPDYPKVTEFFDQYLKPIK